MTGTTTALVVLAMLGTKLVSIPIPATTGYFNVGDIFVILAGLWLGPVAGCVVGVIGPTAADAMGYPQYMLATAVTKGLEGLLVGLIGGGRHASLGRKGFAAAVGAIVMVAGYFVFQAFIYPALGQFIPLFNFTTLSAALVEAPLNAVQGAIGASVGFGLWKAVAGFNPQGRNDKPNGS